MSRGFFRKKAEFFRARDLSSKLFSFLDGEKTVLDVGCGNGRLSKCLEEKFGLEIQGLDIILPKEQPVPIQVFDGKRIPFPKNSFDAVFLFDVLHHIKDEENRQALLAECLRVANHSVIIKDHYYKHFPQKQFLKLVDFAANLCIEIAFPFEFISRKQWDEMQKHKIEYWKSFFIPNVMVKLVK